QAIILAAKALAGLRGQAAADLDEVRFVAERALRHRVVLNYRAEAERVDLSQLLANLLQA
ncbi:MAG: AAA family ATPase, partial [Polyangiaceae bacterium]|nr:AAA family ATPase [Polyangiaceae bacterium]